MYFKQGKVLPGLGFRAVFFAALFASILCVYADPSHGVEIKKLDGKFRVEIGGELFTEYIYKGYAKPILYPVIGPLSIGMTRNYPMKEVEGEAHDHRHHKSIWYGQDKINGVGFWHEAGHVVQHKVLSVSGGEKEASLTTKNRWESPEGKVVCTDTRTLSFSTIPCGRVIDWDITIHASHGDVTFGDTKEGTMAIRTHPNLRLTNDPGRGVTTANGKALNSEGVRGRSVWGKRASWVDYWGKIKGHTVGIGIFDHPANPRHPTWWHARHYGLIAANPCGLHHFEGKPSGAGDLKIPEGESLTFRYRFVFHKGGVEEASIPEHYADYATETVRIPESYGLKYWQPFDEKKAIGDFSFTDPEKWSLSAVRMNGCLESEGSGSYRPKVRSPHIIGLLSDRRFGDFILEADLLQTGKEYGHRDMCVFFGFTDPSNYYYVHMATHTDPHAHNIFIVDDKPRTKISTKTTEGIDWGRGKWHKVRVERKASEGTVKVFFDDMETPIMLAKDKTFKKGYVGFGSFDDSGCVDNIRIWAPEVDRKPAGFFEKK